MLIYKDCIEDSEGLQYICDPCEITEGGGVRSLCLLKKGTTIPNPYTQLDIDILVGAGLMHIMSETRGSFDGGTPKMITGYGDNKERNIGSDYVLQVKDPTFADNYAFWEAVENKEDWNIAFRTETQLAVVYDDVTITTKAPAEEGIDTEVVWDIECKWFSKSKPTIQPYSGKFDTVLKTLDVIYGGTIANGGAVKLTIDSNKTGYIKLPNGTLLTTVAGVINTTYTGVGGAITYYVPKNNSVLLVGSAYSYLNLFNHTASTEDKYIDTDGSLQIPVDDGYFTTDFVLWGNKKNVLFGSNGVASEPFTIAQYDINGSFIEGSYVGYETPQDNLQKVSGAHSFRITYRHNSVNQINWLEWAGVMQPQNNIICDGDSRTVGYTGAVAHPYSDELKISLDLNIENVAVGGDTITYQKPTAGWIYEHDVDSKFNSGYNRNICVIWGGVNDIQSHSISAADVYAGIVDYCNARKAAGFEVYACTEIAYPSYIATERNALNALLINTTETSIDGIIRLDQVSELSDVENGAYFLPDEVHLTAAGYEKIAEKVTEFINSTL